MRSSALSVGVRLALFAGLGTAAYLTGSWQGMLPATANSASRNKANSKQDVVDDGSPFDTPPVYDLAQDAKDALEKLAELPTGFSTQEEYRNAFRDWAKNANDAPLAAAAALALPPGLERNAALKGVVQGWGGCDAKACLDWASGLPATNSDIFKDALLRVGEGYAPNAQPALAAQYVDKLPDATARNDVIKSIANSWANSFSSWSPTDPDAGAGPAAALAWLDKVATGPAYDSGVENIFDQLAGHDPASAATFLDQVTDPADREQIIGTVAGDWAASSPQAAVDWVQSLPDAQTVGDKALAEMIGQMASNDPASAVALIQNSSIPLNAAVAGDLMDSWAEYDPQAALAWANSLPDGEAKNAALDKGLLAMSDVDLTGAWNDTVAVTANDPTSPILGDVFDRLADSDPAQAAKELQQLPANAQLDHISDLAESWAGDDPQAFANWVNTLPPGPEQDKAVAAALEKLKAPGNNAINAALLHTLTRALQNPPAPSGQQP